MKRKNPKSAGFTLLQTVVTLGIFLIVATLFTHYASAGRSMAHQTQCLNNLKSIAMAAATYRQEVGRYPEKLDDLTLLRYIKDDGMLHCPGDPTPGGNYNDFYVPRAPQDSRTLPILSCPFHQDHNRGVQAYANQVVEQFATQPARLSATSSVSVQRPGEMPVAAVAGMAVRGADIIRTGEDGGAVITFADNSSATLSGGVELTILQSFIEGKTKSPLYTLVRQMSGEVLYRVHHGSKFDVATPTSVCGALGTEFRVIVTPNTSAGASAGATVTKLFVIDGKVRITTVKRSSLAPLGSLYTITGLLSDLPGLPILVNGLLDPLTGGGGIINLPNGGNVLTPNGGGIHNPGNGGGGILNPGGGGILNPGGGGGVLNPGGGGVLNPGGGGGILNPGNGGGVLNPSNGGGILNPGNGGGGILNPGNGNGGILGH